MKTILFMCSGNYYRSRYAEIFFNWLAVEHRLAWKAESRGFRLHPGNLGPISAFALARLQSAGIHSPAMARSPRAALEADFESADLVIAVKEAEHRPMMAERFPAWTERIEYWHIDDLDCADPIQALPLLETRVRDLISRLSAASRQSSLVSGQ